MNRHKVAADFKRVSVEIAEAKKSLAQDIAHIIDQKQLTQTEAAFLMKDAPSQVSLVVTGKLRGFSFERLIRMRAMLGATVKVITSPGASPQVRAMV